MREWSHDQSNARNPFAAVDCRFVIAVCVTPVGAGAQENLGGLGVPNYSKLSTHSVRDDRRAVLSDHSEGLRRLLSDRFTRPATASVRVRRNQSATLCGREVAELLTRGH